MLFRNLFASGNTSLEGVHYNGLQIIDFKYDSDYLGEDLFLNYLKLFTNDFFIGVNPSEFLNICNDLQKLFNILYKTKNNIIIYDAFYFDDIDSKKLQEAFKKELQRLDLKYSMKNINISVCVLLKYIQHRAPLYIDNHYKPDFYIDDLRMSFLLNNINMANIIGYKEDVVALINVFNYIIKFSEEALILFSSFKECTTSALISDFIKKCFFLNDKFFSNNIIRDVSIFSEVEIALSFYNIICILSQYSDINYEIQKINFRITCEKFKKHIEASIHELSYAVTTLGTLRLSPKSNT